MILLVVCERKPTQGKKFIDLGSREVQRLDGFRNSWIQHYQDSSSFSSALSLSCGSKIASESFGLP